MALDSLNEALIQEDVYVGSLERGWLQKIEKLKAQHKASEASRVAREALEWQDLVMGLQEVEVMGYSDADDSDAWLERVWAFIDPEEAARHRASPQAGEPAVDASGMRDQGLVTLELEKLEELEELEELDGEGFDFGGAFLAGGCAAFAKGGGALAPSGSSLKSEPTPFARVTLAWDGFLDKKHVYYRAKRASLRFWQNVIECRKHRPAPQVKATQVQALQMLVHKWYTPDEIKACSGLLIDIMHHVLENLNQGLSGHFSDWLTSQGEKYKPKMNKYPDAFFKPLQAIYALCAFLGNSLPSESEALGAVRAKLKAKLQTWCDAYHVGRDLAIKAAEQACAKGAAREEKPGEGAGVSAVAEETEGATQTRVEFNQKKCEAYLRFAKKVAGPQPGSGAALFQSDTGGTPWGASAAVTLACASMTPQNGPQ